MDQAWVFGPILCDLWHSVDVLASTSSILHLCVISLDRCPGITSDRDYLKIQNWLGDCPLKWDHNMLKLLSLKWTHGRLHHVIFLTHVCAPCGGVKNNFNKGLKGRGLLFYDVNIFSHLFPKICQVLGHHRPVQLPDQDERQEGGLPDRDRLGVLRLHLLPRHRLVAPHCPG